MGSGTRSGSDTRASRNGGSADQGGTKRVQVTGDSYRLRFGEMVWEPSAFTAGNAVTVASLMGRDQWVEPREGPIALVTWLSVLIAQDTDEPLAQVMVEVSALSLPDLLSCIEVI